MDTLVLSPLLAASKGLNHLAFRPDGARLAVADTALNLRVREGDRTLWSRRMASLDPKESSVDRIRGIAFSPDGVALYVIVAGALSALDAASGELLWSYHPPRTLGFLVASPTALAIRNDGLIAAAFDNGAIGVWTSGGDLWGLWKDLDVQRRLAFLPSGTLLGDDSFGLSVFDVESRERLFRWPLRDRSFGLAVAWDGRVAVRTLHEAWQMAPSGEVLAHTPVGAGLPLLAYHPLQPVLALGAAHEIALVDGEGSVVNRREIDATVLSLGYSLNGLLLVGGDDGSLTLID